MGMIPILQAFRLQTPNPSNGWRDWPLNNGREYFDFLYYNPDPLGFPVAPRPLSAAIRRDLALRAPRLRSRRVVENALPGATHIMGTNIPRRKTYPTRSPVRGPVYDLGHRQF